MAEAGDCTLSELYATPRFRGQAVATSIGVIGFNVLGEWLALSSWGKRPAGALYRIGYWELERVGKSNSPTSIWSKGESSRIRKRLCRIKHISSLIYRSEVVDIIMCF